MKNDVARQRLEVMLAVACGLVLVARPATADTIRLTADPALVWSRPSNPSFVVTQLPRDTRLDVVNRVGDWYEVVLPPGRFGQLTGFIRMSQATLDTAGPMSEAAMRAATLNAGARVRLRPAFLNLDVTYRLGGHDLTRSFTAFADTYAEAGRVDSNYGNGSGYQIDVTGSQAVWGQIGVGVGLSFHQRTLTTKVEASVPHPFFFNRPRAGTLDTKTPTGTEVALHIPLVWIPVSGKHVKVLVFGGPSVFRLTQNMVSAVTLSDPYPHDTVSITGVTTTKLEGNNFGFHAGGDVAYFFSKVVGIGAGGRYSSSTIRFKSDGGTTDGKAGGPQIVTGLRVRF